MFSWNVLYEVLSSQSLSAIMIVYMYLVWCWSYPPVKSFSHRECNGGGGGGGGGGGQRFPPIYSLWEMDKLHWYITHSVNTLHENQGNPTMSID